MKMSKIEVERLPLSPEQARRRWSSERRKKHKRKTKTNMDKYCRKKLVRKCPNCKNSALERKVDFVVNTATMGDVRRVYYRCPKCGAVWKSSQTIHTWQSPGKIPDKKITVKEFKERIEKQSIGVFV